MNDELLVREFMTENPVTIRQDESAKAAFRFIDPDKFRHLPVVDGKGEVVGILSDRDLSNIRVAIDYLDESLDDGELGKLQISEIMTSDVKTIEAEDNLQVASSYMIEYKINALPVVQGQSLVGIITSTDIMRALMQN